MKPFCSFMSALLIATLLAPSMVTAQRQVHDEADDQAIRQLVQQFAAHFNAGDAQGVAELFTDDGTYYHSVGGLVEGREALQQLFQRVILEFIDAGFENRGEVFEMRSFGDTAYVIGHYAMVNDAIVNDTVPLEGHFMFILVSDNGDWKIHRQISNMLVPNAEIDDAY